MSSAKMRVLKPEVDEIIKEISEERRCHEKATGCYGHCTKKQGQTLLQVVYPCCCKCRFCLPCSGSSQHLSNCGNSHFYGLTIFPAMIRSPVCHLTIPFYGDHVSLFTLLMAVSTIMYTYLNNQMMGQQSNSAARYEDHDVYYAYHVPGYF